MRSLDDSIARAGEFLRSKREADGLWRDFETPAGKSDEWVTAFVCHAMKSAGEQPAILRSAHTALAARQRADGGWGYSRGVPGDCDSTAWALLALQDGGASDTAISAGVARLLTHQRSDGGFATYAQDGAIEGYIGRDASGWTVSHPCVTAVAMRALASTSHAKAALERAAAYLIERRETDGGWRSYWWTGRGYCSANAVAALRRVSPGETHPPALIEMFLATQAQNGAWAAQEDRGAEVFETSFSLSAVAEYPGPRARAAAGKASAWLLSRQLPDGGWLSAPMLRLPPPQTIDADQVRNWRTGVRGVRAIIADKGRVFTTAAALLALSHFRSLR